MAATITQYPSNINHEKLCLQMGGDGKPVSLEMEGKVVSLDDITIIPVHPTPEMQKIGAWAVADHNKQTGEHLVFVGVTGGWKVVIKLPDTVATLYDLYLVAMDKKFPKNYEAVVLQIPELIPEQKMLLHFKELMIKKLGRSKYR